MTFEQTPGYQIISDNPNKRIDRVPISGANGGWFYRIFYNAGAYGTLMTGFWSPRDLFVPNWPNLDCG